MDESSELVWGNPLKEDWKEENEAILMPLFRPNQTYTTLGRRKYSTFVHSEDSLAGPFLGGNYGTNE